MNLKKKPKWNIKSVWLPRGRGKYFSPNRNGDSPREVGAPPICAQKPPTERVLSTLAPASPSSSHLLPSESIFMTKFRPTLNCANNPRVGHCSTHPLRPLSPTVPEKQLSRLWETRPCRSAGCTSWNMLTTGSSARAPPESLPNK